MGNAHHCHFFHSEHKDVYSVEEKGPQNCFCDQACYLTFYSSIKEIVSRFRHHSWPSNVCCQLPCPFLQERGNASVGQDKKHGHEDTDHWGGYVQSHSDCDLTAGLSAVEANSSPNHQQESQEEVELYDCVDFEPRRPRMCLLMPLSQHLEDDTGRSTNCNHTQQNLKKCVHGMSHGLVVVVGQLWPN